MKDHTLAQDALPLFYLSIPDLASLGAMYMPFIRNGGLFVSGRSDYELGATCFVLVRLMDEQASWPVCARIIWKTCSDSRQANQGIGLQFLDSENKLKRRLETLLDEIKGNSRQRSGMFWQRTGQGPC